MSAASPARAPRAAARPQRVAPSPPPPLRVVEAVPGVARAVPFAVLVAALLTGGLVLLLMLHTLAAQDAFRLHDLQHRAALLSDEEQQLAVTDQQAQAPSTLAARARSLGMVPTGSLKFTKRRNGVIVAVASAVPAPPAPAPAPAPVAVAKASPKPTRPSPAHGATAKPATKPAAKPATKPATKKHAGGRATSTNPSH